MMPKRIQLRRKKGWRLPEGARSCARPSKWGNRYPVAVHGREQAVALHRADVLSALERDPSYLSELRGRDLACYCGLDVACHVDTYIELSNR